MKKDLKDFGEFEKKIGYDFRNRRLLREALTHRSFLNEAKERGMAHNERLEFLGDAVLELAVTTFLYFKYPQEDEGALTAYRAGLVNANTLSEVAARLGAEDFLLLSRGEAKDAGRARQFILANAFEAIVGAIYLDGGYSAAEKFIAQFVHPLADEIVDKELWRDAKSFFQEIAQEKEGITPSYRTLSEMGPDHDKEFRVGIFLGDVFIAEGRGKSKQDAEQAAASAGLAARGWRK